VLPARAATPPPRPPPPAPLLPQDMQLLQCLPPTSEPKATEFIPQMIDTIQRIIANGHAYVVEGDVYFDVASLPSYGRLSGRNQEDNRCVRAGVGVVFLGVVCGRGGLWGLVGGVGVGVGVGGVWIRRLDGGGKGGRGRACLRAPGSTQDAPPQPRRPRAQQRCRSLQGGRAGGGGQAQARRGGLCHVEGGQGGRAAVGQPLGPGAAGLAHRVQRHDRGADGPGHRHPRRG
jgi:hypothetical protein